MRWLFLMALLLSACPAAGSARQDVEIAFQRAVGNIDQSTDWLRPQPAGSGTRPLRAEGDLRHGRVPRRLAEDIATLDTRHFIPFVAAYEDGVATRAWWDTDLDGDLSDETAMPMDGHPSAQGARSFLMEPGWTAIHDGREIALRPTFRVVLEPAPAGGGTGERAPRYRVQSVFAMMGTAVLDGSPHRAFLLDGDGDGLITASLSDGLFVDWNDDGHVAVDQMSEEFASLRVPSVLGRRGYQADIPDPEGRRLRLRDLGPADPPAPPPRVGAPAPDLSLVDLEGRVRRLADLRGRWVFLYFWASWCPACEDQAAELARLNRSFRPRGFEILGVSYDTQRDAMLAFRARHGQDWPTSFSGRMLWGDPAGRLYRQRGSGVGYLLRPDGILDGIFSSASDLQARLESVLAR